MWEVLNRNLFFVKSAVKRLEAKTGDKFDIYDPNLRQLVVECREPDLGAITKLRRLAGGQYDAGAPFNLAGTIPGSRQQLFRVNRRIPFLSLTRPAIEFYDHRDVQLATLRPRFISWGRKFRFVTPQKTLLFELQIKSGLYRYRLFANKKEVSEITSKWKGQQAEYFAEGFRYAVSFAADVPPNDNLRLLLLAFAAAADRILK
jgi:hypothetical protein